MRISSMAQQSPEVSSTAPNTWWDNNFIHAHNPFPSWPAAAATMISRRPSSSRFSEAADMGAATTTTSMSNASVNASCSHSALSMDSSSADGLSGEPVENSHIWNQVLLDDVNNAGEVPSSQHDAENFLQVLGSRSLATELCHIDGSAWEPHRSSLNYLEKHSGYERSAMEAGNNLPDLVSNWSIAPPNSNFDPSSMAAAAPCSAFLGPDSSITDYLASHAKHGRAAVSPSYPTDLILGEVNSNYVDGAAASALFARPYSPGGGRYQIGHGDLAPELPSWCNQRNLSDQMSPFGGRLSKPAAVELRAPKQGFESSSASGGGSTGTNEGKKKRSADSAELKLKKTKFDSPMVDSATKLQVPKVRMAEKISALQQFVSPFGKTDQASVLTETLHCIRILQEEIQLLTGPCLKPSVSKEHSSRGEMERKENAEANYDLRSKGLCLVPVSSIPQLYRESSRPDYWMPPYRACFYR